MKQQQKSQEEGEARIVIPEILNLATINRTGGMACIGRTKGSMDPMSEKGISAEKFKLYFLNHEMPEAEQFNDRNNEEVMVNRRW